MNGSVTFKERIGVERNEDLVDERNEEAKKEEIER